MKRTKEEAQATKKILISKAFMEFLETGFENSKLEVIAEKAGVTRGALYWHFKDKKDLLESVIEYKDMESIEICTEIIDSDMSSYEKLNRIISLNFPDIKTKKKEVNFVKLKVELYNYFIKHGDKRNAGVKFTDSCYSLLEQMKKENLIRDEVDIRSAAFNILTMCSGSYLRYCTLPENIRSLKTLKTNVLDYLKLIMK